MTQTLERKPGSKYTAEQIENALVALAHSNGSSRLAARLLEQQGIHIPHRTLEHWKHDYAERLTEIEKRVEDEIWRKTSRKWRNIVDNAQDAALEAIDATRQAISEGDTKAVAAFSGSGKNMGILGGIGTEKSAAIDGRPMTHTDPKDINALLRGLERFSGMVKVNWQTIEGEAKDVTDEGSSSSLPAPSSPSGGAHRYETKDPELAG